MVDSGNGNELSELIRLSATEDFSAELHESELAQAPHLINHLPAFVISWFFCLAVAVFFVIEPLPKQHDLGLRSVETRVSVAMYHMAHRVESYRKEMGALPVYLEEGWQESDEVQYEITEAGYVITGRSGEFELIFREGDDPEKLIHYLFHRFESR